ncbi:MAG: T9SS type A sorting domain-containing protein [FCB group bacterium]|nr:T9SS type A sorting domain-containing protein [FCB group bacterium]
MFGKQKTTKATTNTKSGRSPWGITLLVLGFLLIVNSSLGQIAGYQGSLQFKYAGAVNGTFTAQTGDSLSGAGGGLVPVGDTTYIVIPAFQQTAPDTYDVFVMVMRDTLPPVEPQTWTLPGEDPFNPTAGMFFIPGIDSALVAELLQAFSDSALDTTAPEEIITTILSEFADNIYMATSATITIDSNPEDSLVGTFQGGLVQASIPPTVVLISDGFLNLARIDTFFIGTKPGEDILPAEIQLAPPYPNPFNVRTTISYSLPERSWIQLSIIDLQGKEILRLWEGVENPGRFSFVWNAENASSGIYFIRLRTNQTIQVRKLILLK